MQPDESRNKMRRRFQWRLLLLVVVLSILTFFLLTQRVTAPTHATPTPSETVLADTLTLIDPIWQTATAFHIERLPELMTITQEALTATRTLAIITPLPFFLTLTPSEAVSLAETPTLIDPIWQTATTIYVEAVSTITQEALTATQTLGPTPTWGFPTIEAGVPEVTLPPGVISNATAAALTR